jgi:hypothetical protein
MLVFVHGYFLQAKLMFGSNIGSLQSGALNPPYSRMLD